MKTRTKLGMKRTPKRYIRREPGDEKRVLVSRGLGEGNDVGVREGEWEKGRTGNWITNRCGNLGSRGG